MRPAVKLADQLVKGQLGCDYRLDYRIGGHARYSDVRSAAQPMLAGVLGTYGVIYLFAPKRAVNHDRLAANSDFNLFQKFSQALEICNFTRVRLIFKFSVIGSS